MLVMRMLLSQFSGYLAPPRAIEFVKFRIPHSPHQAGPPMHFPMRYSRLNSHGRNK